MRRFYIMSLLLLLVLAGCRAPSKVEASGGEVLSPEEQQSLYEQRVEQEGEPNTAHRGTVYWTPSGTKYHKDPDCSYIQNAKQLQSGTVAQATNHGASEPCSRCTGG